PVAARVGEQVMAVKVPELVGVLGAEHCGGPRYGDDDEARLTPVSCAFLPVERHERGIVELWLVVHAQPPGPPRGRRPASEEDQRMRPGERLRGGRQSR